MRRAQVGIRRVETRERDIVLSHLSGAKKRNRKVIV